jgi:hypothetical protein
MIAYLKLLIHCIYLLVRDPIRLVCKLIDLMDENEVDQVFNYMIVSPKRDMSFTNIHSNLWMPDKPLTPEDIKAAVQKMEEIVKKDTEDRIVQEFRLDNPLDREHLFLDHSFPDFTHWPIRYPVIDPPPKGIVKRYDEDPRSKLLQPPEEHGQSHPPSP